MRDFSGIAFALGFAILVVVAVVVLRPLLKRLGVVGDRRDAAPESTEVVIAPASAPKCSFCQRDATHRPYRWVRDHGIVDYVRRKFGAPARVRVGRDPWAEPVCCETHDPVAHAQFVLELGVDVNEHLELERKWEVRRARFETVGWRERVKAQIAEHNSEFAPAYRGNVVQLPTTGTEE